MKSVPITSLAIVFAAVTSLPASARDVKLGPVINNPEIRIRGVPNNGCTMYEHLNGGGESWKAKVNWKFRAVDGMTIYREVYNETGPYWNDKISSVRCDLKGNVSCSAYLYEHANQGGGRPVYIEGGKLINLTDQEIGGYYRSQGFDNKTSSFLVDCTVRK